MVVQQGDTIQIPKAASPIEKIVWQQNFADRTKDFYAIPFTIPSRDGEAGVLYCEVICYSIRFSTPQSFNSPTHTSCY